jgi:Protein of unknown function (DUF3551)
VKIFFAKLAGAIALVAAALCLTTTKGQAGLYGSARWCAVTDTGGDNVSWDCEYDTVEDCTPAVLNGSRGYCALNPYWRADTDQN